jgi:hypothetical protein
VPKLKEFIKILAWAFRGGLGFHIGLFGGLIRLWARDLSISTFSKTLRGFLGYTLHFEASILVVLSCIHNPSWVLFSLGSIGE